MTRYSPRTGQPTTYQTGPFDSSHLYLQWGGKLPGGEQWSCGLRYAWFTSLASTDPAAMLAPVTTAVQAFHQRSETCIHSAAKLSFVKLNAIGPDGHYYEDSTYEQVVADVAGGGTNTTQMANQVAWAVSLITGFSRGPAHRGRFYLPLPAVTVAADGLISAAVRDTVKGSATTFLTALNAVNSNYDVAVFSRKAGAPAHRNVTGIEMGRVLDTQRRRRRSLVEGY